MGAMASKKASELASSFRAIAVASASEVSGPVATMPGDRHPLLGQRPGGLAAREPAAPHPCPPAQLATDSAGVGSSTVTSCPHLRHLRETPLVLVCFSSIPTNPQLGQATGTGRFHVE